MRVPFNTAMPIYHQIAQLLLSRARSGDPAAQNLQSEKALCQEFGVSRTTIRQALDILKRQNLLWSQRGVGTRFTLVPEKTATLSLSGDPLRVALDTPISIARVDEVPAPADVAEFLGIAAGTPTCRLLRVHELDSSPFSVAISHLPLKFMAVFSDTSLRQPIGQSLWEHCGLVQQRSAHTIRIVRADEHIAALLSIALGDPLLNVHSAIYLDSGVPIRWTHNYFCEDRYQYTNDVLWEPPRPHGAYGSDRPREPTAPLSHQAPRSRAGNCAVSTPVHAAAKE